MKNQPAIPDDFFVTNGKEVETIFAEAVHDELLRHKKLGNSIVTWRDGEVVILAPDEIPVELPVEPNASNGNGSGIGKHL